MNRDNDNHHPIESVADLEEFACPCGWRGTIVDMMIECDASNKVVPGGEIVCPNCRNPIPEDDDDFDDGDFDGLARHALPAIREHIAGQLKERERPPAPLDAQEMRHELERLWHMPITDSAAACNLSAWHINKSEAGDLALNKLHTETPAEVERFIRMATSPIVRERGRLCLPAPRRK